MMLTNRSALNVQALFGKKAKQPAKGTKSTKAPKVMQREIAASEPSAAFIAIIQI